MGTLPAYQKRGAASLHLAWGTELADKSELACWVQASPMSFSLYQKFGFVIQDQVVVPLHESCGGRTQTSSCMMRESRR